MIPAWSSRSPLAVELASKMPQLGLSDILFIAAIVHLPNRPYGSIVHLAGSYRISRVSVYKLGYRVVSRLRKTEEPIALLPPPEPVEKETVSKARIDRTILTALFPGNASIRPTREILHEALDTLRSVGYISALRLEAGQRAGEILSRVNYAPLGQVIPYPTKFF